MKVIQRFNETPVYKFNQILNELEDIYKDRSLNLSQAIIVWCNQLSIDRVFIRNSKNVPPVSQKIEKYVNQWLKNNLIIDMCLEIYRLILLVTDRNLFIKVEKLSFYFKDIERNSLKNNIQEAHKEMNNRSILIVGFILTGIGLLLFLLKQNKRQNNSRGQKFQNDKYSSHPSLQEKYTLALLIKSDRYQELIHSLKDKDYLQPEDSSKLYGATQGLWIGAKSQFDNSQIKRELDNCKSVTSTSEYDVHFVTIELDEDDSRFDPGVNPMDRRDAFMELGKRSPQITVSPRLPCKAYENTEFYNR